jgi:hypothetical protein
MDRDPSGRFVKGQSGNPAGRPKKEREEQYLEITLSAVSFTDWRKIIQKARDQAMRGDAVARKFLADYLIGPPVQKLEHGGTDGGPITIQVVRENRQRISSQASHPDSHPGANQEQSSKA